ncbi:hypothetical protein EC988_006267, partial [Linderina pennispora]
MLDEKQPLFSTPAEPATHTPDKCQRMYKKIKVGLLAIAGTAIAFHILANGVHGCEHEHLTPHTPDFDAGK